VPKEISMLVVHLAQTMHQSCGKIKIITKQIKMSFRFIHVIEEYNLVCPK
jgi:hypothetical protein